MGRTEKPLAGPPNRVELARYLRYARASAGVTYEEMARHAVASPATLKRTASGISVPKLSNVDDFMQALRKANRRSQNGLGRLSARRKWEQARMEERGTLHLKNPYPPGFVDQADFKFGLFRLYERAGAPPLREVQQGGGGAIYLPLTTLTRIIHQKTLPAYQQQLISFLNGCGKRWVNEERWLEAYVRVTEPRAGQEVARQVIYASGRATATSSGPIYSGPEAIEDRAGGMHAHGGPIAAGSGR
ncbi:helix-turn-helix transcriptional regulator [Streptomyces sp. NPDC001616]|uniref:helix-turn-helix domain-containing protein n=1 Tax=Streptomyces sp. NPDC001616 TaxID=3156648 RepID=UPI0033349ACB